MSFAGRGFAFDLAMRFANNAEGREPSFKTLSNTSRLPSKSTNNTMQDTDAEIGMLMEMGFDEMQSRLALKANDGNVDAAIDDLFAGLQVSPPPSPPFAHQETKVVPRDSLQAHEDRTMYKAEKESQKKRAKTFADCRTTSDGSSPLFTPKRPSPSIDSNLSFSSEEELKDSERMLKEAQGGVNTFNLAGGDANSTTRARPGAFRIPGRATDVEEGNNYEDTAFLCDNAQLVAARAIHHDSISDEQVHHLHSEVYHAELMTSPESITATESTWCTKRRLVALAVVAVLLIGGAVAGLLYYYVFQPQDPANGGGGENVDVTAPAIYLDTIRPSGRHEGDRFADFVAMSRDGTTIAAGAEVGNYVQAYRHSGVAWEQLGQTLHGSGQFGKAVDLNKDGNMMIVGAWNNNEMAEKAGHAKVFRLDGGEWKQVGQTLLGRAENEHFGWYVSMANDGRTVAVSAIEGNVGGKEDAGYVRVFTLSNGNWVQLGSDLTGENPEEHIGGAKTMVTSYLSRQ